MLVTVSRQYCAGGSSVAKLVAQGLGFDLVDSEFVEQVARRAGLTPEEVAAREERPASFLDRFARSTVLQSPELFPLVTETAEAFEESSLIKTTRVLIAELAKRGRAVLVGRGAAAALAHEKDVLKVRVIADRAERILVAIERMGVTEKEAPRIVDEVDRNRARYHREFYHRDWDDPLLYHLVLNTTLLGYDGAAALVIAQARRMGA